MIGMPRRHFAWALRARGPAISAWPLPERMTAVVLLRRDPAARQMLAAALAEEDAPTFDAPALARVVCPVRRALAPLSPLMRGVRWAALAGCVLAGLGLGVLAGAPDAVEADLLPALHPTMPATVLAALEP